MTFQTEFLTTKAVSPLLAEIHRNTFDTGWSEAEFAKLVAMPGALVQFIHHEAQPVGFCLYLICDREAEILTLGVLPENRGCSAATFLLEEGFKYLRAQSVNRIFLEVSINNMPALKLYQTTGFAEIGRRPNYYQEKTGKADALILQKEL